jgi:Zn-finger nucleic acid-binding protein
MELFERRGYFFCRYCGAFHFPETAGPEGVRVIGQTDPLVACPVCRGALSQALLDDAHPVRYCEACRGVLVPRSAFARVVNSRRAWASTPPTEPRPLESRDLERELRCPGCGERMATHPYYGPGAVVIDTCDGCDAVWLDFGELRQIVDAPGRDRGSRNQPARPAPASFANLIDAADASGDDPLTALFKLLS